MKILITGATGIIGSKLIEKLKHLNICPSRGGECQLRILVRKNKIDSSINNNVEFAIGDMLDLNSLKRATLNIDTVIHLAGITHANQQDLYYKINTFGTENLLKACQNNKVKKFIYLSSRTASEKGGAYARSKLLAEKKVQQYQRNWIILSLAEVYGAGGKEAISRLINLVKRSYVIPIIGNGRYLLSPVFIDDVVDSIIKVIQKDSVYKKKYIIAGPEEFTYNDLVDRLSNILNKKRLKIHLPLFLFKLLAFVFYILNINALVRDQIPRLLCEKSADTALAKKDLGFNPRNFEAGLKIMGIYKTIN